MSLHCRVQGYWWKQIPHLNLKAWKKMVLRSRYPLKEKAQKMEQKMEQMSMMDCHSGWNWNWNCHCHYQIEGGSQKEPRHLLVHWVLIRKSWSPRRPTCRHREFLRWKER